VREISKQLDKPWRAPGPLGPQDPHRLLAGGGPVDLRNGARLRITTDETFEGTAERISTTYRPPPQDVQPGIASCSTTGNLELKVVGIVAGEVDPLLRPEESPSTGFGRREMPHDLAPMVARLLSKQDANRRAARLGEAVVRGRDPLRGAFKVSSVVMRQPRAVPQVHRPPPARRPVRILGPERSWSTATGLSSCFEISRTRARVARCVRRCLRARSSGGRRRTPAAMSLSSTARSLDAGRWWQRSSCAACASISVGHARHARSSVVRWRRKQSGAAHQIPRRPTAGARGLSQAGRARPCASLWPSEASMGEGGMFRRVQGWLKRSADAAGHPRSGRRGQPLRRHRRSRPEPPPAPAPTPLDHVALAVEEATVIAAAG